MCVYTFDLVLRGLYNLILAGLAARIIQDEPSLSADWWKVSADCSARTCDWEAVPRLQNSEWIESGHRAGKTLSEWASGQMKLWLVWERDFPQTQTRDFKEADFHWGFFPRLTYAHVNVAFHVRMMCWNAIDYYYFGMFGSDGYLSGSEILLQKRSFFSCIDYIQWLNILADDWLYSSFS